MVEQRNIVITGIQPWDIEIGSNCKNIAREFAKTHRVLYVNSPIDRISAWKKRSWTTTKNRLKVINKEVPALREVEKNLWVLDPSIYILPINWLPSILFKPLNWLNGFRFAGCIDKAMSDLGFSECSLFTDSDMFRSLYLKEFLDIKEFVYYSRDNLMTVPYWEKHGAKIEPVIMQKADIVVANSPHLAEKAKVYNSNSFYVGQGCDIVDYQSDIKHLVPEDLTGIKGPIVGYVGLLTSRRLDINVIEEIASAKPHWNVVLVGPEEASFKNSSLHNYKNIHFLGPKSPERLPAYVKAFDVCINPQVVNELTKGNYPRKIDEYLAAGKITVATYTPTMEVFKDHCYLAISPLNYIKLIEKGLKEDSEELAKERTVFAASHSWKNNVRLIWESLDSAA
jgi:teichuronic acid biosynthesis glycosyltransferase TuaH